MDWRKIFRRAAFLLMLTSFFAVSVVHAEIKTYEGFGEYFMNDETIDVAKNQAELIAERDALEQVSFYVKSQSSVQNSLLNNDEIIVIAAGILRVTDTKFSITSDDDIIIVKSFVTAEIDTDELEKLLEQEVKSRLSGE